VEPGLIDEAKRLLEEGGESARLLAGVAVLPMSIAPGEALVLQPFSKEELAPGEAGLDVFYLVSPWRRGDALGMYGVRLDLGGASAIRHGEEVLVIRAEGSKVSMGNNLVVRLEAEAVLPTRWAR
jgi:hypothetical protein